MKIKVSETTNTHLDWLVAKCLTLAASNGNQKLVELIDPEQMGSASTDWSVGGPIIDREGINLRAPGDAKRPDGTVVLKIDYWYARVTRYHSKNGTEYVQNGPTALIAAMRCYVASRLGDEVEVPDELGEQS